MFSGLFNTTHLMARLHFWFVRSTATASLFILVILPVFSQVKYEKESRIRSSEVPQAALEFVRPYFHAKKVRWYFEENLNGNSIEAKVRQRGSLFSIEFDTAGVIQDVEKLIRYKDIPETARRQISIDLDKRFEKYHVQRVQRQYSGELNDVGQVFTGESPNTLLPHLFEIVVRGRDESWEMFEFHYASDGTFLDVSSILVKNSDHLEY